MRKFSHPVKLFSLVIFLFFISRIAAEIKETHKIIEEWIDVETLISEESSTWAIEQASLSDLLESLEKNELVLDEKLAISEEEESGAIQQRTELNERKEKAEKAMESLFENLEKTQSRLEDVRALLPSPLAERLSPFWDKLKTGPKTPRVTLRQRVETIVSLMQSIHIFHRSVLLERQEFTLNDGQSREFHVIYFGLGSAYFVNESGTVSGYGTPTSKGWAWTRMDEIAKEVTTGVQMLNNRTMPKFLQLPLPSPEKFVP
ncbi:MAG: DUF3450 family protein [Opitutales bacterium]